MRDDKGKPIIPNNIEGNNGKGFIDVSLRMPPLHCSHHGWVQRQSTQKLSFAPSQYKPRFLMLHNGKLCYYENEYALEHPRGSILCNQVTKFSYGPDKGGEMTLHLVAGDEEWLFHWMEGETMQNILCWLRKLEYACKKTPLNGGSGSFLHRIEGIARAAKASTTPVAKTSARRGSTFFGGK